MIKAHNGVKQTPKVTLEWENEVKTLDLMASPDRIVIHGKTVSFWIATKWLGDVTLVSKLEVREKLRGESL